MAGSNGDRGTAAEVAETTESQNTQRSDTVMDVTAVTVTTYFFKRKSSAYGRLKHDSCRNVTRCAVEAVTGSTTLERAFIGR